MRDANNRISGIITAADLAAQFAVLTKPFLILGEIERLLRTAVDRRFSSEDLYEALDPDDDREVEGAQSLPLGEVQRLLGNPTSFTLLGWNADRKVFIRELDIVRTIRNEVMHFSPDPIAESEIERLKTFASWISRLENEVTLSRMNADSTTA